MALRVRICKRAQAVLTGIGTVFLWAFSLHGETAREQRINAIQQAIQDGQREKAKEMIAAAIRNYPKDGGILNLRGILHAQAQNMPAARADFQEAVRLEPGLLPAWKNLGRACQALVGEKSAERNKSEQDKDASECAIRSWKHVLASESGDPEARLGLATLYEWQGDFAGSLKQIEAAPASIADDLPFLALRCADYAGLGRTLDALDVAKRMTQADAYSEETASSIFPVLRKPENAAVLVALAEPLYTRGQASAETLRLLSSAYQQRGNLSDARKALEAAAVKDPEKTSDLYELTRLAYQLKDREGALGYLGHIRDLAPSDARSYFLFGVIAVEMELPIEARRSLNKAVELDPKNPMYSLALGSVLLSNRNAGDAIPYFQTYLAAHPDDIRARFGLGMAYFSAADYAKARVEMTAAAKRPETAGGAEYFLGRIDRAEGNIDESVTHLERAIQLVPAFPDARAELARVWLRKGEIEKARTELDAALKIDRDNYQANTVLQALYERTHDLKVTSQRDKLKELEVKRKDREQLMLRTIEMKPF